MLLLRRLRELGYRLTVEGDRLRVEHATRAPPPELAAEIRKHKAELIAELGGGGQPRPEGLPPEALAMLLGLLDAGLWLRLAPSDRPPGWFVLAEGVPHCGQAELDKLVDQYLAWHDPAVELLLRHCAAGEWNRLSPLEQRHRLQALGPAGPAHLHGLRPQQGRPPEGQAGSPEPPADIKAKSRELFALLRRRGRNVWVRPDYVPALPALGRCPCSGDWSDR